MGSDISTPSPTPVSIARLKSNLMLLTAVGDSISSGLSDAQQSGYLAYMKMLGYPAIDLYRASSANWAFAHSGYTTAQMIAAGYHISAAASPANIVIVFAGANDFPTASTYLTTFNNIITLATPSILAGKQVVIALLPRTHASTAENKIYMNKIAGMLSNWCKVNSNLGVRFCDLFTRSLDRTDGGFYVGYTVEGVHPSEEWHWWIAKQLLTCLGINWNSYFDLPVVGGITGNPTLQGPYTGGLASGWTASNCTPTSISNTGFFVGTSQQIAPTAATFSHLYRTDAGVLNAATIRCAALFEVLTGQSVSSLYLGANPYWAGGGNGSFLVGNGSTTRPSSNESYLPAGLYPLFLDFVATDNASLLLSAGAQGDAVVIHYAGSFTLA